ncbi:hypothetical protein HALG_00027 [Halorubrum virus CGphi46]|uniref:Uncharacterized protein n=1 Tax=Halorubrum virus CGphi46 TaxID=754066 RepID=R9TNU7_9CAUD|nr:hypothetical protein HALG_00027 [Halorubrum virus CGphi46]AGN33815.1 hypothetical protein HALG_00027 [Halorubrum virus CGphi46]
MLCLHDLVGGRRRLTGQVRDERAARPALDLRTAVGTLSDALAGVGRVIVDALSGHASTPQSVPNSRTPAFVRRQRFAPHVSGFWTVTNPRFLAS